MLARPKTFIVVALMLSLLAPAGPALGQATRPRVLYVSNIEPPTVAMFTVDRQTGSLTPLADPVRAGTEPRGVVPAPDGRFVYVADPGSGRVLIYRVGNSGALTALDEAKADGDPFGLAMAPNGRTLYAGSQGTSRVTPFSVGRDGRLTRLASLPSGGTNPRGVAVSPDSRFVYVTNGLRDPAVPGTLAIFAVTADGGLKLVKSFEIGRFGAGITMSPDGRFLYVESQATNQIRGYRRGVDGLLTELPGSPFASPDDPEGIIVTPDAGHVYVAATGQLPDGTPGGPGNVQAFRVQPGGTLGPARLFDAGALPNALAMSPSARFLYAANSNSGDITAYGIGSDGTLRQIPGSPFAKGIDPGFQAIAMLPNQGPTARFSVASGTPARFDATASDDPDGRVVRYDWDFGDGTVLPNGGPTPTHTYTRPGTFTVKLTVTDDEGCSDHQVFTGQSTLCTGSPTARTSQTITA
jgi:6-phosphogluconolactonase (cycloisomerase 2 family)